MLDIDPAQEPYLREAWRRADAGDSIQSIARWIQSLPREARGARYMSYQCVRRMLSAAVYVARPAQGVPDVLARPVMRWPALIEDDLWSGCRIASATDRAVPLASLTSTSWSVSSVAYRAARRCAAS